jgi:hypothetical protein
MRSAIYALLTSLISACCGFAASNLTIVLQFDARHSEQSIREMKRELQSLMRNSGVELNWRQLDELSASDSFASLVVVRFHGFCEMQAQAPPLSDEPVALGYTHLANGHVIPFADVECDRIRSSLASAETGQNMHSDLQLGRAIGRVLAHELHHIIDRTRAHTEHGISRKSLSPRDLIADLT